MKSLALLSASGRALAAVSLAVQVLGCDMHVDKQQARYVKALTDTKVLLVNLEAYKEKNGHLPASLSELVGSEPALARLNLTAYTYASNGIPVTGGRSWLLSIPDPKHDGWAIVGKLPIEVTNAVPANAEGGASGRQPVSLDTNQTSSAAGSGGDSTNEFVLFKYQSRHQAYEWRLSEAKFLATPEWDFARRRIPLDEAKAWKIARDWFKKHEYGSPELISIQIRRLAFESEIGSKTDKRFLKRFYYRIDCVPAKFDSMVVVVLMDGTVVEPKAIPDLPVEGIK